MGSVDLAEELLGCSFGDARLVSRLGQVARVFSQKPNVSIPAAFVSKAEIEGCYRFFDNDKVAPDKILQPHIEATYRRIEKFDFVLLVQDTTELDLTRPEAQVRGAGPMDCEARRGAFFHPLISFTEDGVSLGLVGQKMWTRQSISKADASEKCDKRHRTPIEEKESYRWIEGLRAAQSTAQACPETTCVCVGDSESDIYDVFAAADQSNVDNLHLLVRAGQNRNTTNEQDWLDQVRLSAKIGNQTVNIRAREAKISAEKSARHGTREARTAELDIRKATVEVARPVNGNRALPAHLTMNIVLCEEPHPPANEEPIRWMLVTTLPIDTDEQVQRIIRAYCIRWQIEVYFKTLKSGCRIEYRRFEDIDRVFNCLALLSIVAWRLMYICRLGRECPDLDCEIIFEPSEWKSVYAIMGLKPPEEGCPRLNDVVRAIARLGGFMDRPKNEPGTQTLWVGLQRCYDLSTAWKTFGPEAKKFSTD